MMILKHDMTSLKQSFDDFSFDDFVQILYLVVEIQNYIVDDVCANVHWIFCGLLTFFELPFQPEDFFLLEK